MQRPITLALLFTTSLAAASDMSYRIDTAAGSNWVGDNGPATSALLFQADGIASDPSGNLYLADAQNHRIRKVTRAGTITTLVGTGVAGFSGDGGPAAAAQLDSPYGLVFDGPGNLYIADLGNARVRRVGVDGIITTVAGGGALPAGGVNEGSAATMLSLIAPRNVAWDGYGSIYISDFGANRVYKLSSGGSLTTAAGTGIQGFSGDGGAATRAQLAYPAAIALDRQGSLYIGDTQNHLIRKVTGGIISSVAKAVTPTGFAMDAFSTLYVADQGAGQILAIPATGALSSYNFLANDVCFGVDGYLYATNGALVSRVSFTGPSVVVAGGGSTAYGDGGPAVQALLRHPSGVSADALGNIYIADRDNNRIRRVAADGTITTVAGTGAPGNSGDEGPATLATLNGPAAVTVDAHGNLFIADTGNGRVRVVASNGVMLPLMSGLVAPVYALPDGNGDVYIADSGLGAIVEISSIGVTSVLLTGLQSPRGLALDGSGNLYFTEAGGKHVRRLDQHGNVSSLGEGTWSVPTGVAVDGSGNVFVADAGLNQIVSVDPTGLVVDPIAGTGAAWFSGDGGSALGAQLNSPWDICTGPTGTLYIADLNNNRIRLLTPGGAISAELLSVSAVNAASLQPGPIAPGMLIDLLGTGLTAADAASTEVLFGATGAPVLSLNASQLLVLVPPQIDGLTGVEIQVAYQGNLVGQVSAVVTDTALGLYADASGQLLASNPDGTPNSAANPAARGSIIVFFGTGEGVDGQPISVTIGGYPAEILYAGPVTGYAGLLQINARVPAGYVAPGNLNVVVTAGPSSSQPGVFIAAN